MSSVIPIVALDVPTMQDALRLVDTLGESCRFYKVGSELFTAAGPDAVRAIRASGCEVFLDLKLHDIPNTVRGAARSAATLGARLLTVHAVGGVAMVRAAVEGAGETCGVLAVTVLTSLDAPAFAASAGRDPKTLEVGAEVLRLAGIAREAQAHGVVCSGHEAAAVRAKFGDTLQLLVPGIRLAQGDAHDQARIVTPRVAASLGARYIVLGRAVTGASAPAAIMREVHASLAVQSRK